MTTVQCSSILGIASISVPAALTGGNNLAGFPRRILVAQLPGSKSCRLYRTSPQYIGRKPAYQPCCSAFVPQKDSPYPGKPRNSDASSQNSSNPLSSCSVAHPNPSYPYPHRSAYRSSVSLD